MAANIGKHVLKMNNGKTIPVLGLGTWQSSPGQVKEATKAAIESGYRHIDTAQAYSNEGEIGEAIQELIQAKKIRRDELFITTKLAGPFMEVEHVKPSLKESLRRLKVDYVDLFLIHTPLGMKFVAYDKPWSFGPDGKVLLENHDIIACWKAMESLVDEGLTKSIGVSNFNSKQVDRILQNSRIKPVTNQIECHAYFPQEEFEPFLKERSIFVTAYAPIGSPGRPKQIRKPDEAIPLLESKVIMELAAKYKKTPAQSKVITELAAKYKKTPAQICLRNLIQRGMVVIPKSVTPKRIKENSEIFDFELNDADMKQIAGLKNSLRLFDGSSYGAHTHPENPCALPF